MKEKLQYRGYLKFPLGDLGVGYYRLTDIQALSFDRLNT